MESRGSPFHADQSQEQERSTMQHWGYSHMEDLTSDSLGGERVTYPVRTPEQNQDISMADTPQAMEDSGAVLESHLRPLNIDSTNGSTEIARDLTVNEVTHPETMHRSASVTGADDGMKEIKREPDDEWHTSARLNAMPPNHQYILAAQRAMLSERQNATASGSGVTSQASPSSAAPSKFDSIFGAGRKRANDIITQAPESSFDEEMSPSNEQDLANKAMAAPEEDNNWMHDGNSEDDEYDTLKQLRDSLNRKHKHKVISQDEIVELIQTQDRMDVLSKLRGRSRTQEEEENELFIPESSSDSALRHEHRQRLPRRESRSQSESDQEDSMGGYHPNFEDVLNTSSGQNDSGPSSSNATKAKPRRRVAKTAREVFEREEEKRREKDRKSLQRSKSRKGKEKAKAPAIPRKKGKGKGKAISNGSSNTGTKATRSKTLMRPADDTARKMLADLLHNDAIADRIRAGFDPEPEIQASSKKTQLEQILASVPKNINLRQHGREKQDIIRASKSFGYAKIRAEDGKWLPKGMKSSLFHHQLLGARFMLERELSKHKPSGGINADAMGLGKTIEMLATMVGNPPTDLDKKNMVKATLLVLPSAVISQWESEIRKHVKDSVFPRVLHFKATKKVPMITLKDQDIVLCSYAEVMNSYPYPDATALQKMGANGLEKWIKNADSLKGDLHKMRWYRIVLDEAHAIKNYKSRTAIACQRLQGLYRWCLTGTPVLNRIEELYSYLRFLRIPGTDSYDEFVRWFCDPDAADCQARIAALLSFSMIRRNMNTKLLGRPIISLPEPHPEIQYIDFSREEQIIYRITESRFRANINSYFASGSENRNYGVFMVQLLRLRQCTSHPIMIEQTIKECWTAEDLAELKMRLRLIRKDKSKEHPLYQRCQLWVHEGETADGENNLESASFGRGQYGHDFKISKYLQGTVVSNQEEFIERVICALCSDVPKDPQITDCNHIFCKDCLTGYMHEKASQDQNYTECPTCKLVFTTTRPYIDNDIQFPDDDIADGSDQDSDYSQGSQRGQYRKGKDLLGFEPSTKPSSWLSQSDMDRDMVLLPSAKTIALKAKILKWLHEAPEDKIVIFTQFRLLARIVGRIADEEKWKYLYYSGDAKDDHRTKVVDRFHSDRTVKLLIAGLKCGGQGLNLTTANRCISLDLWWNHAVEQQAFGRTFRIGQDKETYFTRICVRNSVEMRMLAMQADKLKIIERMINDGEDVKKVPLDIKELASLFGYLNEDSDGNLFVTPDYVEEEADDAQAEADTTMEAEEAEENDDNDDNFYNDGPEKEVEDEQMN